MKLPKWYTEERQHLLSHFDPENKEGDAEVKSSPSGEYQLCIEKYPPYSRGRVVEKRTGDIIADIKRNHESFWYAWVKHQNKEYLLCGEDTQGYSIVDLRERQTYTYIDPNALEGLGFRWLDVMPSPSGKYLLVEGCYFACPKITAVFDFSNPKIMPLPKVTILDNKLCNWYDVEGWIDDTTIEVHHDKETFHFNVVEGRMVPC